MSRDEEQARKSKRNYPLPPVDDDPKFTTGLLLAVAETLEARGYPKATAMDLVEISVALHRFIYGGNK